MLTVKIAVFAAATIGLLGLAPARADQLADIKARGKLICGTVGTFEPFSFQDSKTRETVGYEIDQCRALAKTLSVTLELKSVAVEARIPELLQGRVDILAASMGYTEERAQQVQYSLTTFVSRQMLLSRTADNLSTLQAAGEKKISAIKGSSGEKYVRTIMPNATVLTFQDPPSAFLALMQGKVSSYVASELALMKFKEQAPDTLQFVPQPVALEFWGYCIRKNEPAFLEAVNQSLRQLETSGEGAAIFDKWIGKDSPYKVPRTFTLDQPVRSPILKPGA